MLVGVTGPGSPLVPQGGPFDGVGEINRSARIPAMDLLVDALRQVAALYVLAPPEAPGSAWCRMSLADDEIAPGLVVHLRVGDAGDLDLLVDQADLIVLNLRFERT